MKKQQESNDTIAETFTLDPYQGVGALLSMQKPGYERVAIERTGTVATVKFKKRGGVRVGAGRPIDPTVPRCYCGKHTLARAVSLRLKCGKPKAGPTAT